MRFVYFTYCLSCMILVNIQFIIIPEFHLWPIHACDDALALAKCWYTQQSNNAAGERFRITFTTAVASKYLGVAQVQLAESF